MSATGPPPMFSPGNLVAPPVKKIRVGGTPGNDGLANDTDQAISKRRAELDRLKQMQRQNVPTMTLARDQLGNPSLPSHPPPKVSFLQGNIGVPPSKAGTADVTGAQLRPPGPPLPGTARRLEQSFVSSPNNVINRNVISPKNSPTKSPSMPKSPINGIATLPFPLTNGDPSILKPPLGPHFIGRSPQSAGKPVASLPQVGMPPQSNANGGVHAPNESLKTKSHVSFHPSVSSPQRGTNFGTPAANSSKASGVSNAGSTPFNREKTELPTPSEKENMSSNTSSGLYSDFLSSPDSMPPMTGMTPIQVGGPGLEPPSTGTRQQMLSTLRAFADTPPSKEGQLSSDTAVKKLMSDEILSPSPRSQGITPSNGNKVSFLSPLTNISSPTIGITGMATPMSISKRAPTPFPKLKQITSSQTENLKDAVELVTFEYESDGATFTVRRPYGFAAEDDLWFSCGIVNAKAYAKNADVEQSSTIEVVATINYDGSVLTLHGDALVRHRYSGEFEWKEFGNVKENDVLLGNPAYIARDASEKQYSLDLICEGALSVREHYCSCILSTAEAFQLRLDTDEKPLLSTGYNDQSLRKSPTSDANVGTEDFLLTNGDIPKLEAKGNETTVASRTPEENTSSENASDVLSTAVYIFFSTIFSTVWFILVRIPFMVLTHMIVMVVAAVLLSIIRVYLADDNGTGALGATMSFMYNQQGIM